MDAEREMSTSDGLGGGSPSNRVTVKVVNIGEDNRVDELSAVECTRDAGSIEHALTLALQDARARMLNQFAQDKADAFDLTVSL